MIRQLPLRQRPECEDLDPAGEGFGQFRQQKNIRRPCEEEPAGPPGSVDFPLYCEEQIGYTPDFVENDGPRQTGDESLRIRSGRTQNHRVVQRKVLCLVLCFSERLSQRALARLTGTLKKNNRCVR